MGKLDSYEELSDSAQALKVVIMDADGNVVDPRSLTGIFPGTGATNLGKAEDAAHTSGDVGVMMLGVRNHGSVGFGSADQDYVPIGLTNTGAAFAAVLSATAQGDGIATSYLELTTTGNTGLLGSGNARYNGTTWDRERNNVEGTALASDERTATTNSPDIVNHNARGIMLFLNVTAASGTGGLTTRVQVKDPVSGNYFYLGLLPTAVTSTGITVYAIYPGLVTTGWVSNPLPRTFRVSVVHGDASSYTYSVGYCLIN